MTYHSDSFISAGRKLAYRCWRPDREAGGKIVNVIHGLGEHGGCYEELARFFTSRGLSLCAMDLQGFGLSGGRRGHVNDIRDYLEDEKAFLGIVSPGGAAAERILFGHSMGALLALAYLQSYPLDYGRAVIAAPALDPASRVSPLVRMLGRVVETLWPSCPLRNGIAPEELSGDEEMRGRIREDELRHNRISPRLFFGLAGLSERVKEKSHAVPTGVDILFLHGEGDSIIDYRRTQELYASLKSESKELHILDGARHDLLNDQKREDTYRVLDVWLAARSL